MLFCFMIISLFYFFLFSFFLRFEFFGVVGRGGGGVWMFEDLDVLDV